MEFEIHVYPRQVGCSTQLLKLATEEKLFLITGSKDIQLPKKVYKNIITHIPINFSNYTYCGYDVLVIDNFLKNSCKRLMELVDNVCGGRIKKIIFVQTTEFSDDNLIQLLKFYINLLKYGYDVKTYDIFKQSELLQVPQINLFLNCIGVNEKMYLPDNHLIDGMFRIGKKYIFPHKLLNLIRDKKNKNVRSINKFNQVIT